MPIAGCGHLRPAPGWSMTQRIASDELGISEEEMDWRLKQLTALLPGLESRLIRVRAHVVRTHLTYLPG